MNTQLFMIDPMAASSYGLYNAMKKEEGSFVDFLLSYDSQGANEGDNSWLTKLITNDNMEIFANSGLLSTFESLHVSTFDLFSQRDSFDAQAQIYKLQIQKLLSEKG